MKLTQLLLLLINTILFVGCNGQENKKEHKAVKLEFVDWKKYPDAYAKQIIPKEIEYSGLNYELTPIQLKRAIITTVDSRKIVLAICSVTTQNDKESALTYYLIDPQTNEFYSKQFSVLGVKGCDLNIVAFTFKDINHDGKDEFIYIESNNYYCRGEYWISSNIDEINPTTSKNGLDDYLKLKNNTTLNRKVKDLDTAALQKALEEAVKDLK